MPMGDLELPLIPMEVALMAMAVMLLVFVIILIMLWRKLGKLRKGYMQLMNGSEGLNIEQVLAQLQEKANQLENKTDVAESKLSHIREQMAAMKSHIGIVRYNAFGERGNEMSFSVAITDERQDGIVISGIHNREHTFVYAKPLENGQSTYALSPEEKEAISRSVPKK